VTGKAVEGAVFQVKYLGGTSGTGGTVIGTYKTSVNGSFTVTGCKAGTYVVEELSSDSGHVIDTAPQTALISGKEQDVVQIFFGNGPKASLTVKKIDAVTHKPLSDVEFMVTLADGSVVGDANGKFVTDSAGSFTINGLNPGTTLVVKETRAKEGYLLDDTPQTITVKAGQAAQVEFRNAPKGSLIVLKKDSVTGQPLEGVTFKVTLSNGEFVPNADGKLSSNGLYKTDKEGKITITGVSGTLVVTEVQTLPNYIIDPNTQTQTVVVNPNDTQTLTFYNTPKTTLHIYKYIEGTKNQPLAGVTFLVTDSSGKVLGPNNGQYVTDKNGRITITGLTPGTTITARETKTVSGFLLDGKPQSILIKEGSVQSLTFWNQPIGGIELIKVNAADKSERIPNVTFEIRRADDGLVDTITTDKRGRAYLELEDGAYYAKEVDCPSSFQLDATPIYFTIEDGETVTKTVTNKAFSGILLHKIDSKTREGIPNVTFLLYDGKMNPIEQFTTDQRGYAYINTLDLSGKVYLRELNNDGYVRDDQLKTVYVKPGETTEIIWENTPITGQIQIWKKSADDNPINGFPAGTPLEGAVFEIYDKANNLVDTVKSNSRGLAVSKQLPLSRYTVKEVTAPAYYSVNSEAATVYLEHEGQIVQIEVLDKSVYTNVSVSKSGYTQVVPGQSIRYTFREIGNNSTVALDNFYWRDTLPTDAVRLDKIITGTWSAKLNYKVVYKTNINSNYRTLADNLNTQRNYTLDASPAALGLASNEFITEVTCLFGRVPANFKQMQPPYIYCNVLSTLSHEYRFTNKTDVGGVWQGQWIMANDRWVTIVYRGGPTPTLPRTGY